MVQHCCNKFSWIPTNKGIRLMKQYVSCYPTTALQALCFGFKSLSELSYQNLSDDRGYCFLGVLLLQLLKKQTKKPLVIKNNPVMSTSVGLTTGGWSVSPLNGFSPPFRTLPNLFGTMQHQRSIRKSGKNSSDSQNSEQTEENAWSKVSIGEITFLSELQNRIRLTLTIPVAQVCKHIHCCCFPVGITEERSMLICTLFQESDPGTLYSW